MNIRALIAVFIFATFFGSTATNASSTTEAALAADPVAEKRLQHLSEELRCLVCQNQTIADSNADLANDFRREIRKLIAEGRSDQEILDFVVARYGDFVRYRPPLKGTTLLLWFGPLLLLMAGIGGLFVFLRRRTRAIEDAPLSAAEQRRAETLLNQQEEPKS